VLEHPQRQADRYFTVLIQTQPPSASADPGARLGLAISKRSAPRAVDRNRIKRLIRESFRAHKAALPSVDLVVMCRRAAISANNAALAVSIKALLLRLAR
jgi:ribonuclease P protein component